MVGSCDSLRVVLLIAAEIFSWSLSALGQVPDDGNFIFSPPPPSDESTFLSSFNDAQNTISSGVIAGIVVSILTVIVAGAAVFYFLCMLDKKTANGMSMPPFITIGTSGAPQPISGQPHPQPGSSLHEKHFTFDQVIQITNNLRIKLGEGGFGPVYYGKLENGKEVAVKRLSSNSHQGSTEFLNEVEILSRVHHKNLVSLVGYCSHLNERILIYEYMPKGTLKDHLHGLDGVKEPLDWLARLRIAVDAASGLKYLHNDCDPRIIHRDIKSSNILLDGKFTGKVADFGLSKLVSEAALTHISTAVKGTFGYLDPEYAICERLTDKSDVYSFGIILLELICGREAVVEITNPPNILNISDWARPYIQNGNIESIVDGTLGGKFNTQSLKKMADIAMKSVDHQSAYRPSSSQIIHSLEEALEMELRERGLLESRDIQKFETHQHHTYAYQHHTVVPILEYNPLEDKSLTVAKNLTA